MRRRSSDSRSSASSGSLLLRCLLASAVALPVSLVLSAPQARATATCPTGFYAIDSPVTACERVLTATGYWTVPAGVTSIDYVLVGAGGGGGGSSPGYGETMRRGGGGGAANAGVGGDSPTPAAASAITPGDSPGAVMNQETSLTALAFPGASSPTRGKSLPPPPEKVQVVPLIGRLRSSVAVHQPSGDGASNILATVIVVRDDEGKVITRITVEAVPGRSQSRITVPLIAPGYFVNVYNVNEVGVSMGALATSPLVHATTISSRGRDSAPTLFGKRIGRTITFDGGLSTLDREDKRVLNGIARSIARSTDRIFITGFASKGGGSEAELAALSTDRARAVATYLAERGVRVWMRYWGAGSLEGVGHPRERRVEIHASALAIPRNLVP